MHKFSCERETAIPHVRADCLRHPPLLPWLEAHYAIQSFIGAWQNASSTVQCTRQTDRQTVIPTFRETHFKLNETGVCNDAWPAYAPEGHEWVLLQPITTPFNALSQSQSGNAPVGTVPYAILGCDRDVCVEFTTRVQLFYYNAGYRVYVDVVASLPCISCIWFCIGFY